MTEILYGGSIEHIKEMLEKYTLTDFGSLLLKPTFQSKEVAKRYKDYVTICGNFEELSNAFYILTNDKNLIEELKPYFVRQDKFFDHYDKKLKKYVKGELK